MRLGVFGAVVLLVGFGGTLEAQDVNVGPLGIAEQSTTGFGGDASRGNDGNTDGTYGNASVTHTDNGDLEPWWRIDLLDIYPLTRIVLWNRTDCCSERLSNFEVSVLDEDLGEVFLEVFFEDGGFPEPGQPFEIVLPEGTEGAYVQVALVPPGVDGQFFLSLAEVQVFTSADVELPPTIDGQPQGGRIAVGDSFDFTVSANGTEPLTYQWIHDGTEIDGATEATYSIASATLDDAGSYEVIVTNVAGEARSNLVVLTVAPGPNLARCGVASQSSLGFGGTPERAIDGNVSGVYNQGSVTHTATGDLEPWWQVQLQRESTIASIAIWNRTDCCSDRLTNFSVSIFSEGGDLEFEEIYFNDGLFPDTTVGPFIVDLGGPVTGNLVRVAFVDPDLRDPAQLFMSLAEVEVFGAEGEECEALSLAHRDAARVSQTSTLGGFIPELGVDGNLDNFTHTLAADDAPHWQVDLGDMLEIEEIRLVNRRGCCPSRLRDIIVTILDASGENVLFESDLLNPENEIGGSQASAGPDELVVALEPTVTGQIVRVERVPDPDLSGSNGEGNADEGTVLSLAEVFVFGPSDCEVGDTHCNGLDIVAEPEDGGPGIYTFEVDSSDDSGNPIRYLVSAVNTENPGVNDITLDTTNATFGLNLGFGDWEIEVTATDGTRCDAPAADATCTATVTIERDPCQLSLRPEAVATQSSTGFGGAPQRAIDGNTSGTYNDGSSTHTATGDPDPWWEVDLGDELSIGRIVLWNRIDCCSARLTDFQVSVLDADREVVFEDFFFEDFGTFPDTAVDGFEIIVGDVEGQIVRINFTDPSIHDPAQLFLTLSEVQIFCADGMVDGVGPFKRGDCNQDGTNLGSPTDGIFLLTFLFAGGRAPDCLAACDMDADGQVPGTPTDALFYFNFNFLGGQAMQEPLRECGISRRPEDIALGCENPEGCN